MLRAFLLICAALLIMPGCSLAPEPVKTVAPPRLASGLQLVVARTMVGVPVGYGAIWRQRTVIVREAATDRLLLHWEEERQVMTEASARELAAWEEQKARAQVGAPLPERPQPQYTSQTVRGALQTLAPGALNGPSALLPPALWPDSPGGSTKTGALWLGKEAFAELVKTRKTRWAAGPESIFGQGLAGMEKLRQAYEQMTGRLTPDQLSQLQTLKADQQLVDFRLKVNGQEAQVQAVHARNWFVDLYILNDPAHPLVLKATFNPVADGPLDLLSPLGWVKALMGYQVVSITTP